MFFKFKLLQLTVLQNMNMVAFCELTTIRLREVCMLKLKNAVLTKV